LLTIIIPVYNNKRNIKKNIEIIDRKIKSCFNKYEIIIVDDSTNDNTLNNLKNIVSKNVKILKNSKNIGKSYSILKAVN
jgi:polyisoprenyl-phosphate glycosyltransferase